jgi:hypothetical protein
MVDPNKDQQTLLESSFDEKIFVTGPAGSGKTTAGVEYFRNAILSGIPAEEFLILTPQRSLAKPFRDLSNSSDFPSSGLPTILTVGGLAQRMVSLFWPMVAKNAGFKSPSRPPLFLTLETAQYYMAQVIAPLLQKGFFDSVTIEPNRIYSQLLDNMNKAAFVGFDIDEIASRLTSSWSGVPKQSIIYEQAQDCIRLFRQYCLENNLMDFSLQFEVFNKHLWPSLLCRSYLKGIYSHLIYDNIEEDVPVAHDIVASWLPDLSSALLIRDAEAGFRTFLGADDVSALGLRSACTKQIEFTGSFIQSSPVSVLERTLSQAIRDHHSSQIEGRSVQPAYSIQSSRFIPQALDWITGTINTMIRDQQVDPGQIVVLTPFLSDSLRFTLTHRMEAAGIPYFTFRPSRSLRDEPPVTAMFTLAKLAHPQWGFKPTKHDLRYMLMQIIPEIDLIRADLVAQILYSPNRSDGTLVTFEQVRPEMQQRISYIVGQKFEDLRNWLEVYQESDEVDLDIFFARIFGELLSQRGLAFHENFATAALISRLIESARKFRQILADDPNLKDTTVAKEYIKVVEEGLIAAQCLTNWDEQKEIHNVLVAPAFTYLMSNRPVAYQFWLDIGSSGWWSRLDQPLTQPYVLSRNWPAGHQWTGADDLQTNQATLDRIITGLLRRCSTHVDMITVGLNESGSEERGALLVAVQTMLRGLDHESEAGHV